jgi:hypothetical protein
MVPVVEVDLEHGSPQLPGCRVRPVIVRQSADSFMPVNEPPPNQV